MADREGRSRLSAFAAGNMPAPEPDRLGMLAESGQRRSSNVEDMAHIQMLEPRYLAVADLPGVADTASIGLRRMARPWRYRDISDVLGEISSLLPTQRIPPMPSLPAAPRTAGYALGGDVDPDAPRDDMRDREDAVAFYVTPAQARTLTDAGLIQSGAWGSPEALDRANLRQDMTDADRARAWRETGWAIHHGQPRTWVDAPLGLSPRHVAPFSRGEFVGGSLNDVLSGRGVEVMRALGLGDLPIELRKGSEAMGGTRQYSDTGKAARIFGVAPDRSSLSDLLNHEGQHAVDMAEHPIEDPYANPIAGTRAENIFRAASGRTLPSGISADDMAQSAPETASYLRSAHEDRARDNTIRQRDPKRFRNVPPGQIDTYSEDAWPGRRFDGAFGVKLRDYDPNRRFASGGSVDDVLSRYSEPVRTWPGEDTWDRDAVLPFARRVTSLPITGPDQWVSPEDVMRSIDARSGNKWQFAWPRMATDVADAAKAVAADSGTSITPMRAPSDYSPEEMEQFIAHGMAGALTGVTGGLARVALASRLPHGEFELGSSGSRLGDRGPQMSMREDVPPLPMDEASRLARAREMGFDTDKTWYHGTRSDSPLVEFSQEGAAKTGRVSEQDAGMGFHFSENPEVSAGYGADVGAYYTRVQRPLRISEDDVARAEKQWLEQKHRELEDFDRLDPDSLSDEAWRAASQRYDDTRRLVDFIERTNAFGEPGTGYYNMGLALLAEQAKKHGHDGIIYKRWDPLESFNGAEELMVFDPTMIRRADAAFDPTKSSSASLLASHRVPVPVPREDDLTIEDILNSYAKD